MGVSYRRGEGCTVTLLEKYRKDLEYGLSRIKESPLPVNKKQEFFSYTEVMVEPYAAHESESAD